LIVAVWHDERMSDSAMGRGAGIILREYRHADLDAIFRLDQICFAAEFRFDRRSMRHFAEGPQAIALVAESGDGGVAGFVIVHVEWVSAEWVGYVVTLDVAPEFRRMGLAGVLMDEASRRVAAAGGHRIELHVYAGNAEAIRLYESRGYVRVGVERGFYGGQLDALVYRIELPDL
jgi:ribosomal protein S18 acetylase RimI-like enzyme